MCPSKPQRHRPTFAVDTRAVQGESFLALAVVAAWCVQTLSFGSTQRGLSCALIIVCKTPAAACKSIPSDVAVCSFADSYLASWSSAQSEWQTDKSDAQPQADWRGAVLWSQSWGAGKTLLGLKLTHGDLTGAVWQSSECLYSPMQDEWC